MRLLILNLSLLLLLSAASAKPALPKNRPSLNWFPKPPSNSKVSNGDFQQFTEADHRRWYTLAQSEIHDRIRRRFLKNKRAKNVIFFLGDGMGVSTLTASRIMKGQLRGKSGEEENLESDVFDYSSMIKTYNLDRQVPDSAGTATAYLCGVKANFYTLGVNGRVKSNERDCRVVQESKVSSLLEWAQKAGKATGIVTTARVTHASPAASYAHTQDRNFESNIPEAIEGQPLQNRELCKDIASQLIDLEPGANFRVILGGGRVHFLPTNTFDPKGQRELDGSLSAVRGTRLDGRNLINDWMARHEAAGNSFQYVNNTQGLRMVNYDEVDYLMGLFNHTNLEYDFQRDKGNNGEPSLSEMTASAIRILQKERKGFVLFVEGGRIDHANHFNEATTAMTEMLALDNAIKTALDMINPEETTVLLTADHSHGLTINGFPERGNPISGIGGVDMLGNAYTTLMYSTGPGFRNGTPELALIRGENVFDPTFKQAATVPFPLSMHTGEDVVAYARGPFSFLMSGTHEQSYIPHMLSYALCIGQFTSEPHCFGKNIFPWTLNGSQHTNKIKNVLSNEDTGSKPANEPVAEVKVRESNTAVSEEDKSTLFAEKAAINAEQPEPIPVLPSSDEVAKQSPPSAIV